MINFCCLEFPVPRFSGTPLEYVYKYLFTFPFNSAGPFRSGNQFRLKFDLLMTFKDVNCCIVVEEMAEELGPSFPIVRRHSQERWSSISC